MEPLTPQTRTGMPVAFGPVPIPPITKMERAQSLTVRFETDAEAVQRLLPPGMHAVDPGVLIIGQTQNTGIDYLAGRGYNLVRVAVQVEYRSAAENIQAPFNLVMWESDANPIILGREQGGYPKIYGQVPDAVEQEDSRIIFSVAEYGTTLLAGELTDLRPAEAEELEEIQRQGLQTRTLGWKFIPGQAGGSPDADYPMEASARYEYREALIGTGSVDFKDVSWEQAPMSAHIIDELKSLPLLRNLGARVTVGSTVLPRSSVRRLG